MSLFSKLLISLLPQIASLSSLLHFATPNQKTSNEEKNKSIIKKEESFMQHFSQRLTSKAVSSQMNCY